MRDVVVGQFGLRTFEVDRDGHLLPISGGDRFDWRDGVCFAECRAGGLHCPPAEGCSCGIYSFASLEALQSQYRPAQRLVAVIAPEGRARIGQNGTISERARIIALWTRDERLTTRIITATNPAVIAYTDLDQMVSDYGLRFTPEQPATLDVAPRTVLRSLTAEFLSAAGGLGWRRFVSPVCAAILLHLLADAFASTTGSAGRPDAGGVGAVRELIVAADRAVLAVGHGVTSWVVALLGLSLCVSLIRVVFRNRRPTAADGRLFRHLIGEYLRRLVMALVFVGTYLVITGHFPGWDMIIWIMIMMFAASWATGGIIYHLTHAAVRRAQYSQPVVASRDQPLTLRQLLRAIRCHPTVSLAEKGPGGL